MSGAKTTRISAIKTFNLLSIGHRGVGKTVFLAGSYIELHANSQAERQPQLWFDCQDTQAQENIEKILSYIVQTGEYPPPTLKVTNFSFSLKRHSFSGTQTLCHFHWWDIPGEICKIENLEFRSMVSTSHSCCVFIDAYALVYNHAYLQTLEDIIEQVTTIASQVSVTGLKYAFALVLTKCDLLELSSLDRQQLKQKLQPLITRLDAVKANYQIFYSSIPIVPTESPSTLRAKGAAAPLLWLVWELSLAHNPGLMNGKASKVKNIPSLYLLASTRRSILILALAIVGSVGILSPLFVDYKRFLQRQPKNLDVLENIATLEQRRQFDQAVPLMEKLVQQEPKLIELRLQLAQLYEFTGQVSKAETAYNQVLAQQKNNLKALIGLAVLRDVQGDTKTAVALFAQAEKAAPTNLKTQVRALAQKTLRPPAKPIPPGR